MGQFKYVKNTKPITMGQFKYVKNTKPLTMGQFKYIYIKNEKQRQCTLM